MKLRDIGEFGFINRIGKNCINNREKIITGIGDDAAVIPVDKDMLLLVTTDMLIENIHFKRESITGKELGHKSIAVNLSDIAAMGGIPENAFIAVGIPGNVDLDFLDGFYRGIKEICKRWKVNISGGDTTSSITDIVICVTVTGAVKKNEVLLRSGALPGDIIAVTGYLGDSGAGLRIILEKLPLKGNSEYLRNRHILPEPCLKEGRVLASSGFVTSMLDISDGLSSDIFRILEQSSCGARIFEEKIPLSVELVDYSKKKGKNPLEFALNGGEDYALLFTIKRDKVDELKSIYKREIGRDFFEIGEIAETEECKLISSSGREKQLKREGWDHFRK
ncbi:MAG: thiamine-phosphate kinase [Spirochaetes bacterium]|nr:thiamine-phosphate kinase [Spirochaetota bacterium]